MVEGWQASTDINALAAVITTPWLGGGVRVKGGEGTELSHLLHPITMSAMSASHGL